MAGSVTRQGITWHYVIDLGLDGNGRRRQYRRRGFATKKDAERSMIEAQAASLTGELASPGRITLADYVARWLDAVQVSLVGRRELARLLKQPGDLEASGRDAMADRLSSRFVPA